MRKNLDWKLLFVIETLISVGIWFIAFPFAFSMFTAGVPFIFHLPTIQEWLGWQVLAFALSLPAVWVTAYLQKKKSVRKYL